MQWRTKCFVLLSGLILICGCDAQPVDVIDLNKVLNVLEATLEEQSKVVDKSAIAGDTVQAEVTAIEPEKQDPVIEQKFVAAFAKNLNAAKISSSTLGVALNSKGDIDGFRDTNSNGVQDAGDSHAFTVQIDIENNRLVASDGAGNHRPHSYRTGGNFLTGYLIGSMLGRQNNFFSGANAANRPNFRTTPMSSPDYHAKAVSTAKSRVAAASSSARVRTGSGGFSVGK